MVSSGVEVNGKRERKQKRENMGIVELAATWQLQADWLRHAGNQAGRPGNVIQRGCLNMTSLGAIQSAAKPSSGALPGMVAVRLQL